MAQNEKYSYKDFTNKLLDKTDAAEWNDTEVVGSCFHQNTPKTVVFPVGISGVKFIKCNLDNVVIPEDCTVEGGTNKLISTQNDGADWFVDDNLAPIEPMNKAEYIKLGLSIDPAAIPATAKQESVVQEKRQELEDTLEAQIKALEDAATWRK